MKGKAYLKQQIADRAGLDASLLPYHASFLAYLKAQRALGRPLILVTDSNIKTAQAFIASWPAMRQPICTGGRSTSD